MVAVQTSSAAHTSSHHSFDSCQLKQCVIRSNSEQWDTQCKQCTNVLVVSLESRVPTSLLPTTEPNPVAPSHIICRHGLQRHYIIYLTTLFLSLSLLHFWSASSRWYTSFGWKEAVAAVTYFFAAIGQLWTDSTALSVSRCNQLFYRKLHSAVYSMIVFFCNSTQFRNCPLLPLKMSLCLENP